MFRHPVAAVAVLALLGSGQAREQPPTEAQQRPVFRGGTHFVRVDAYPVQDGKVVENLKPEDFEILEDNKPQQIDSFDFVKFETFTPDAVRRDPQSQRAGFDMAADPRYRVFVIFVDLVFSSSAGAVVPQNDLGHIQQPLVDFLKRVLGPQDLFGFLTSRNSVKDLVLGQKSLVIESQLQDLLRTSVIDRDEADRLDGCAKGFRYRADQTYTALEGLVQQLGSLRQERKNVVLVTNYITRALPDRRLLEANGGQMPRIGIANGRITSGERDPVTGMASASNCAGQGQRLAMMDFDSRYRQLLQMARKENVAFYPITPGGLQAPVTIQGIDAVKNATDDLISLAHETDGVPIVNTNDLNGGMKRIADDLAAYYVLGYYTTNTKFDGGLRQIKVRLKASGKQIRARRQYRAPTEAEVAALSRPSPVAPSPASAAVQSPAPVGKPVASVIRGKAAPEPADLMRLTRTDRIRVQWAVTGSLTQRVARILDRAGKALPIDLPVSEQDGTLTVEVVLAPFARGDYSVELTVGSGSIVEPSRLAFRVQ